MIERSSRSVNIVCDSCGDDFGEYDKEDFTTMIVAAKDDGWQIRPDGEAHYVHKCRSCATSTETALQRAKRMFG